MKLALFLDVDRTLTRDYIQHVYARELGCEPAYLAIEQQFQEKKISSTEFGKSIIKLFASHGFTLERARDLFDKVELQPWTEDLLKFDVDKYLVSSGPSYYIERLALNHNIPNSNVCYSEYKFDKNTKLISSCKAINEQAKAQFVKKRLSKYDITIGIGDNLEFDGPFVSACTIPLMTISSESYIYVPNFSLAILLIENILKLGGESKAVDLERIPLPQLLKGLTLHSWIAIGALFSATFGLGVAFHRYFG